MQIDGLHHVALQVRDVAKVARFYVEVLGLPVLERYLRDDGTLRSIWVGLGARADAGFLAVEAAPESTPDGVLGFSMVALRISAAHRAQIARELEQRGVTIEKQTGWTMYFRDPEGNLVGLSHHPDAAESGGGRDGTTR